MNDRYGQFFLNIKPEDWERFAEDVLTCVGYQIVKRSSVGIDGGCDLLVYKEKILYLVSCKHYFKSKKCVGTKDETNILDRMKQFNATGFIGFYSTNITTSLQQRLDKIIDNGNCVIFDPITIVHIMKKMDNNILQAYGPYPHNYYNCNYEPLPCMICGRDCLAGENIPMSIAGLAKMSNGKFQYVYGCKNCLKSVQFHLGAYLEMGQALYVDQLLGWDKFIDEEINESGIKLMDDFYKNRYEFENKVNQRQFPKGDGNWYGLNI
ncbi:hypothetical protein DWZ84_12865 [Coprobacillus sp. AF35-8]|nr:hypothetical protein DWZ84_12865 [Coprobacillus sp. AF35-8]